MIYERKIELKKYGVNELRKMYLDFFEENGHLIMKSFSLVPQNDKSLLLINAGMAPLKPYFTGAEIPPRRRVATCQKCIRTGDIENVGITARHGTFFEMLGNFSFGDYFKREALHWTWEFLTERVGLDPERLYPSVYLDDDEAFEIWEKEIGVPKHKIYRFGKEDNFWEHGAGPCGPCSEVYYDRGEKYGCGKPDCAPGCDCDRYMEIWNDVFTQFDGDGKGNYIELENKNIDTGMGLERLAVVVQEVESMFDIDTIRALRDEVCRVAGKTYLENREDDISIRVITDHIRSASFMISDGITPSNEGRGYVLRRLIRRAARHGRKLGIEGVFLAELSKTVAETSKDAYPELEEKELFIYEVLNNEEKTFSKTIDQGLMILANLEEEMKASGETVLSGTKAFELYDTYGFPLDLTKDILIEKGYGVDEEGFTECMEEQRTRARTARAVQSYSGKEASIYDEIDASLQSVFTGYETLSDDSDILIITTKTGEENYGEFKEELTEGEEGSLILGKTPFYATKGGQKGDTGIITTESGSFEVEETVPLPGEKTAHIGKVVSGTVRTGQKAELKVDAGKRNDTCKNHSATHLLQKALKTVLGDHVEQKGSYVDESRLRFDFVHFKPMSPEEIKEVEDIVNAKIRENIPVSTDVMSIEDAKKTGAMALFGEKYGEEVRVVSMGDFSKEFCGGTHVKNTGNIITFKILSESGIAAGVRRIEAITGDGVMAYYRDVENTLNEIATSLKSTPKDCPDRVSALQKEIKELKSEIESLKASQAKDSVKDIEDSIEEVNGVKVLAARIEGGDMNVLRNLSDELRDKLGDALILLISESNGKVNIVSSATKGAVEKGAHAGNLIKDVAKLVGGGGGGRPDMAQAGGKDPSGIDKALELAWTNAKKQLQ